MLVRQVTSDSVVLPRRNLPTNPHPVALQHMSVSIDELAASCYSNDASCRQIVVRSEVDSLLKLVPLVAIALERIHYCGDH